MKRIFVLLMLLAIIHTGVAQRAIKIEKIGNERWKVIVPIKPKGQSGPYIDEAEILVTVLVGAGNDLITVGAMGGRSIIHKYRYQGVDYDVNKDLGGVGYQGYRSFTYRATIANAGTVSGSYEDIISPDANKSAVIPLGKTLTNTEAWTLQEKLSVTNFEITGYELVQTDLDDVARKVSKSKESAGLQSQSNPTYNNAATQTTSNSNTTANSSAAHSAGAIGTSSVKSVEQMRKEREEVAKAVSDYNSAEKAKSDALKQATDETTSQWAQGNYIQGGKPLVEEFARQGSAAGAYGTAGVAVAAEIGSAIGDAVAARRARKAEEAAYNYEVNQGYNALRNRSYKDALKWYYSSYQQRKNALLSATHVGYMLMRGLGAEKNYSEALKFLNEAANGFSSDTKNGGAAFFLLAEMYRKGLGVSKDPYKAFQLMEEAAKRDKSFSLYAGYNGSEEAYYHLAFQYLAGVGITQNFQKAYDMFLALIDYDLKHEANLGLGVMYYYGLGLKKDIKTAARYFIVASADGNSDALALIKKICDNNELRGKELADLEKAYAKVVSKRYVNRITNNTFGEFLKLN